MGGFIPGDGFGAGVGGGTTDNTTDTHVPYKSGISFDDSDLRMISGEIIADSEINAPELKLYTGSSTPPAPSANDYRIIPNGVYLDIERYSGTVWEQQSRIGGSFFVPNFIEIIREATAGSVLLRDSVGLRNLISSANFSRGVIVGDIEAETFIVGLNEVYKGTQAVDYIWSDVQTDESQQFTGNSHYVELTTTPGDGFVTAKFDLSPVSIPIDNIVQVQVYLQSDLVNPVWQNVTDAELADGVGETIDPVTGEVILEPKFTGTPDTPLRVVINSVDPITLKGSTNDGTNIYFRSYDSDLWADAIVAYQPWKEQTYAVDDKIWQDRDIYICNTSGAQTTDFASNASKWDVLGTQSEHADRVQATGLLEGGVLSNPTTTTVSWTSGIGQVADYTDPVNANPIEVTWDAVTGYTPTNLATDGTTLFAYDSAGSLVEILLTAVTIEDWHDYIIFGTATHLSSQIISFSPAPGNLGYNGIGSFTDFINLIIGPANVDGNVYGPDATDIPMTDWNIQTIANGVNQGICYSETLDRWVIVGSGTTNNTQYSNSDTDIWNASTIADGNLQDVIYAESSTAGRFITVGSASTNNIQRSDTGISGWTNETISANGVLYGVGYAPSIGVNGRLVAVGESGLHNCQYSDDLGDTWTAITIADGGLRSIVWVESLGLFIAVGVDATNNIQYSATGISGWTDATISTTGVLEDVVWSETIGRLVAVGSGSTDNIQYSDDGINWTAVTIVDGNFIGITVADTIGRYVAVGAHTTDNVAYSDDGINWTTQTNPNADFREIAFSEKLARFTATGTLAVDNVQWIDIGNMKIDVIGGNAFVMGSNFRVNTKIPNTPTLPSIESVVFQKMYRSVDPGLSVVYDGLPTDDIDAKFWDNDGVKAAVTDGYWTIQRIFRSRDISNGGPTSVSYGQQEFATKELAIEALGREPFTEKSPLPFTLYRCALLIQQSATNTNVSSHAEFHEQPSFRVGGAQSAAVTIPGVTSPGGPDNAIQTNDGNTFGGSSNFAFNGEIMNINSIADAIIEINADTGASDDTKVPTISMTADGGSAQANIGINGTAGQKYTDALVNAAYLEAKQDVGENDAQIVAGGTAIVTAKGGTKHVGVGNTNPVSTLHVYESSGESGANAGITIEQASTGYAPLHFIQPDGGTWAVGMNSNNEGDFNFSPNPTMSEANSVAHLTRAGNFYIDGALRQSAYGTEDNLLLDIPFDQVGQLLQYDTGPDGQILTLTADFVAEKQGKQGDAAVVFDGVGSGSVPSGFADFTNGLTIELWAYPTAVGHFERFIDFGNGTPSDNIVFGRDASTSKLYFAIWQGATLESMDSAGGTIALNEWHHYTVTQQSDGFVQIYIDGFRVNNGFIHVPNNIARTSNLIADSNWAADDEFTGKMKNLKIYDRAISDDEVNAHYLRHGGKSLAIADNFRVVNKAGIETLRVDSIGNAIAANSVSAEYLRANANGNGDTLLYLWSDRRWGFQNEGSGSGSALRLRNLQGLNKFFHIDTDGRTNWRTVDGTTTRAYIDHSNGNFWAMGNITAQGNIATTNGNISTTNGTVSGDTVAATTSMTVGGVAVAVEANNVIPVYTQEDFGSAVSDEITLITGKVYDVRADITLSAGGLVIPSGGIVCIKSDSRFVNNIVYVNPNKPFISGTGIARLEIKDINATHNSGTQQVFDIAGSGPTPANFARVYITAAFFVAVDATSWGTIADSLLTFSNGGLIGVQCDDGLLLDDCSASFNINAFGNNAVSSNNPLVKIQSTAPQNIELTQCQFPMKTGESAFLISSTTQHAGTRVTIRDAVTADLDLGEVGILFDPTGLDQDDPRIFAFGNFGHADSSTTTDAVLNTNSTNTSIPVVDAWVLIESSDGWIYDLESRISGETDGVGTYTGLEPKVLRLDGGITLEPDTASKQLKARYVKMGTETRTVTFTNGTNVINEIATPRADNDTIIFYNTAGTLPAELREDVVYHVVNKATDSFQVAYTSGGAAVTFTDDGTPTNTYDLACFLCGSEFSNTIAAGSPRTIIVKSQVSAVTGDKYGIFVQNSSDSVDVLVSYGYYRL